MKTILIVLGLLLSMPCKCQVRDELFKVIQLIQLENISNAVKDSILKKGKYYPLTNEENYVEVYTLNVDSARRSARIGFGFESGQRGYAVHEIKLFSKTQGNFKVVYSDCSGANAILNQGQLSVFDYNEKTNQLLKDTVTENLFHLGLSAFFKPLTPDLTRSEFENHSGYSFNLFDNENNKDIVFRLVDFLIAQERNDYLIGNYIEYKWTGDKFIKLNPKFSE